MRLIKKEGFLLAAICSLVCSAISSAAALIFYFGDWSLLVVHASAAAILGLLAAPEFERKHFPHPTLFQATCGLLAGVIIGFTVFDSTQAGVLSALIGLLLGASAHSWIKHVSLP